MRIKWFPTFACVWLLAGVIGLAAEPAGKEAARPKSARPKITISKETTYITGPLRADGYPDYLAALNALSSRGVTPANNAAVPFWQAVGPKSIPTELRPQFFKMLGIKELPEKGAYIVPLTDFAEMKKGDGKEQEDNADGDESFGQVWEQCERAENQPWSKDDCPELFAWLTINELPLRISVEGLKRPRFYSPLVTKEGGSVLDSNFLADMIVIREVGYLLRLRAMLRLKAGKVDEAWQDLLACHRLARLRGQKLFLSDQLIAFSLETLACKGDEALICHANLTPQQASKFSADLDELPALPNATVIWDVGERYSGLEIILAVARSESAKPLEADLSQEASAVITKLAADSRVDWNEVLRHINAEYDRILHAHRKETRRLQREALVSLEKADADRGREACAPTAVAKSLAKDATPQSIGRYLGTVLWTSCSTFGSACLAAKMRNDMQVSLVKLAFALAGYRADHGKYPVTLADLKPKYIAETPKDLFTDKDLIYKPQGDGKGYVLYSLGPNGRDDDGLNANDDWQKYANVELDKRPDDIAIRTSAAADRGAKK